MISDFMKKKALVSSQDKVIYCANKSQCEFIDYALSYTECKMSDLENGDVFILKKNINNITTWHFKIFIGKDDDDYMTQYNKN